MAWSWYLNLEPLSLEMAKEHIEKMTDSNYENEESAESEIDLIPDDNAFLDNFKLGFIAITMIDCFFESSLNTLMREIQGYDPDGKEIRGPIDKKLENLLTGNTSELEKITGSPHWNNWKRLKKVRNTLIHCKNNSPEFLSSWPLLDKWMIGDEPIGKFFTKSNMSELLNDVVWIVNHIAVAVGATVSPYPISFGSDARYGIGPYYCTRKEAELAVSIS